MATPPKRICSSPGFDNSFEKRTKKISIEGNIGEFTQPADYTFNVHNLRANYRSISKIR